jgi:predicted secreted Zn-dependent protease
MLGRWELIVYSRRNMSCTLITKKPALAMTNTPTPHRHPVTTAAVKSTKKSIVSLIVLWAFAL